MEYEDLGGNRDYSRDYSVYMCVRDDESYNAKRLFVLTSLNPEDKLLRDLSAASDWFTPAQTGLSQQTKRHEWKDQLVHCLITSIDQLQELT